MYEINGLCRFRFVKGRASERACHLTLAEKPGKRGKARTQRSLQELQDQLEEFRHGQQVGPLDFDTVLI